MAEEVHVADPPAEEAGETIHLPGPSYLRSPPPSA